VLLMVYHALEATDDRGQSLLARHLDYLRRTYAHLSDTMCSALHASSLPTAALRSSAAGPDADADSEIQARRRGVCFDRPHGGYFVWLRLPDLTPEGAASPSDAFVQACRERGVSYKPGHLFYSPPSLGPNSAAHRPNNASYARLSFAYYSPDEIVEGVRRLAGAIDHVVTAAAARQ
jgi:DNA-binding transcriptional MocR family regulator